MYVVKRDGKREPVMFDKITARVRKLCYGLNDLVEPIKISMRVIEGIYDGVTTSELDSLAAEIAAYIEQRRFSLGYVLPEGEMGGTRMLAQFEHVAQHEYSSFRRHSHDG